jgi:hypothetical protein
MNTLPLVAALGDVLVFSEPSSVIVPCAKPAKERPKQAVKVRINVFISQRY